MGVAGSCTGAGASVGALGAAGSAVGAPGVKAEQPGPVWAAACVEAVPRGGRVARTAAAGRAQDAGVLAAVEAVGGRGGLG